MVLLYINLIPLAEAEAFAKKVLEIAEKLKINPDWLMQVMKSESGLKANAINTHYPFKKKDGTLDGYATGLIQFIPDTARSLGTTTLALYSMTRLDQLDYVYKYFKPYTGRLKSYFDVYLVTFFPVAVPYSNDDNYVFEAKGISRTAIAKANPAININKDEKITMAEFKQYLRNTVLDKYKEKVFGIIEKKKA